MVHDGSFVPAENALLDKTVRKQNHLHCTCASHTLTFGYSHNKKEIPFQLCFAYLAVFHVLTDELKLVLVSLLIRQTKP